MSKNIRYAATLAGSVVFAAVVIAGLNRQIDIQFQLRNNTGGAIRNVVVTYPGGSVSYRSLSNRANLRAYIPQCDESELRVRYLGSDGVQRELFVDRMCHTIHSGSELTPVAWEDILEPLPERGDKAYYRMDTYIDKKNRLFAELRVAGDTYVTDYKRWSYRLDFLLKYLAQRVSL